MSAEGERHGTKQSKSISRCRNKEERQAISDFKVNICTDCKYYNDHILGTKDAL
jgi:hypothetical protein